MKCMSSLLAARLMQLDLAIDSKDRFGIVKYVCTLELWTLR